MAAWTDQKNKDGDAQTWTQNRSFIKKAQLRLAPSGGQITIII